MPQYLGNGKGSDGAVTLSGTDAQVRTTFYGTAAGTTGTGSTGLTIANGSLAAIKQMRGTNVGKWELIQISSYVSGTGAFTFSTPLDYTYTHSGASLAQLIVLKQYSSISITGTFSIPDWNSSTGGWSVLMCNGPVRLTGGGTINGDYRGFYGGAGKNSSDTAFTGEGTAGTNVQQHTANGNGGGAASGGGGSTSSGGGGGGNGTAGGTGGTKSGSLPGDGGNAVGNAALTESNMGGGGGGAARGAGTSGTGGGGGKGGAEIFIFCDDFDGSDGYIYVRGGPGGNGTAADGSGGGGGAGGSVFIKSRVRTLGTARIIATGGVGGAKGGTNATDGASGGDGRIRIESCSGTGTTSPTASEQLGGFNFCSVTHGIL